MGPSPRRHQRRSVYVEGLEPRVLLSTYTVTNLNDSGPGSLREAVEQVNANPGPDTINFAAGLAGTISLTSGQLEINNSMSTTTIVGPGANVLVISGSYLSPVFQIDSSSGMSISGLAINNGRASSDDVNGGAISSSSDMLTVADCTFIHDMATGSGGAIYSTGAASICGCTFANDSAAGRGGAIDGTSGLLTVANSVFNGDRAHEGGAVAAGDRTVLNHVTIKGCSAHEGGAVFQANAPLTISNSTVTENVAYPDGGVGSFPEGGAVYAGAVVISNSTFSFNSTLRDSVSYGGAIEAAAVSITGSTFVANSSYQGGALYIVGTYLPPYDSVTNCTFYANSADQGGAILDTESNLGTLDVTITSSTIVGNSATGFGGGVSAELGPAARSINDCVIAGNQAPGNPGAADIYGTISGSNNLIGTGGSGDFVNGVNGNIVGVVDPMLAPLGNYGGPTQTMPPLPGSPAIDAGSNALAVGDFGVPLATDQRGYYRIFNGKVDIGAVEYASSPLLPGDANADGKVDFGDLLVVARHYNLTYATWAQGDFDGDGTVDFRDLVILARNYGRSIPDSSGVPGLSAMANYAAASTASLDVARELARRVRPFQR